VASVDSQEDQMSVEEQAAAAEAFVRGVVERFSLRATTVVDVQPEQVTVSVSGEDLGLLVGPRGSTLDALQELTRTVVQRRGEEHGTRVNVDVAGYRAKRAAALREFVTRLAAEVVETGEARALEPMTSPDRKIVHDAANLVEGVETTSEGTDPQRYVVIRPATAPQAAAARADGPQH
jgi:spoIIIJ-associated protein